MYPTFLIAKSGTVRIAFTAVAIIIASFALTAYAGGGGGGGGGGGSGGNSLSGSFTTDRYASQAVTDNANRTDRNGGGWRSATTYSAANGGWGYSTVRGGNFEDGGTNYRPGSPSSPSTPPTYYTISASPCTVLVGASSCTSLVSWDTNIPASNVRVRQGTTIGSPVVLNNDARDSRNRTVTFSDNRFALFDSRDTSAPRRTAQAAVSCIAGSPQNVGGVTRCVCPAGFEAGSGNTSCVPIPQCRDNPNDNDGDGYIDDQDPGCYTTPTDPNESPGPSCTTCSYTPDDNSEGGNPPPTVSANPTVIRQGGDTTISWNPAGYPGCTISPVSIFTSAPNLSIAGSAVVTLTTETQVTITCGNLSSSVTIRVIPNVFET